MSSGHQIGGVEGWGGGIGYEGGEGADGAVDKTPLV